MMRLGDRVKDSITGFAGTLTARTTWVHGCVRCSICSSKLKDGKPLEVWFDERQIVPASNKKRGRTGTGGPSRATGGRTAETG